MANNSLPAESDLEILIGGIPAESNTYVLEIEQNIYNTFIHANLEIRDSQNLKLTSNISEGSEVTIIMKSDTPIFSGEIKLDFIINKTSDKILSGYFKEPPLTLQLISKELFLDLNSSVTSIFSDSKVSILKNMVNRLGGNLSISKVASGLNQRYNITSNELTFFEVCNLLLMSSNLLLINKYNSEFYLLDITNIEPTEYIFSPENIETSETYSEKEYLSYTTFEVVKGYNAISKIENGEDGVHISSFDFVEKSTSSIIESESDEFFSNTKERFIPHHSNNFDFGKIASDELDVWSQKRNKLIFDLDNGNIIISVPGNIAFFEIIGKSIQINVPSATEHIKGELDTELSGKYFVISVFNTTYSRQNFVNIRAKKI